MSTVSPKRVLVIGDSMSLAHVTRALVVAQRLHSEGHSVQFATGSPHLALARAEGWNPHELYCVPPADALAAIRRGSHIFTLPTLQRYVDSDVGLLQRIQPDLVVNDMRMSLNVSAQMLGLPYWSIVSGYFTRGYCAPENPPQTFPVISWLPTGLARAIYRPVKSVVMRHFARNFQVLRRRHGLPAIDDVRDAITSPYRTLIADLPEYTPCNPLPRGHEFIGPQLWEPKTAPPEWLNQLSADKPCAYVSMGSTGDDGTTDRIIEALLKAGWRVMVTGGRPRTSANDIFWAAMAPGSLLLRRCSLAVCHGGSGTIYQAIAEGVPVVCIPTFHDQEVNAQRMEALGWGVGLHPRRWGAGELVAAANALLAPPRRQAAAAGQQQIRSFIESCRAQTLLG